MKRGRARKGTQRKREVSPAAAKSKKRSDALVSRPLALLLAVASGCMVFLSFPRFYLFPLEWFAFLPITVALVGRSFWGALFLGFVTGLVTNAGGFYWIDGLLQEFGHMHPLPATALFLLVASYQGLRMALALAVSTAIGNRQGERWFLVSLPFTITALEFLVPFIFPWYLGNGQSLFHPVTQLVEYTGVPGLTFLIVLVNVAAAEVAIARLQKRRPWWPLPLLGAIAFGAAVAFGLMRMAEVDPMVESAPKARIGVAEAHVGVWEKEARFPNGKPMPPGLQSLQVHGNLLKHHLLSSALQREARPDVILWSESSFMPTRSIQWRKAKAFAVAVDRAGGLWFVGPQRAWRRGRRLKARVNGLAAAGADFILAVGQRGSAFVFDGEDWRRERTGTDRDLYAVAVDRWGERAVAVGGQGVIALRDRQGWETVRNSPTDSLFDVTWGGKDAFLAVGASGTMVSLVRGRIRRLITHTEVPFRAVTSSWRTGAVAVGDHETVFKVTRGKARPLTASLNHDIRDVVASGDLLYLLLSNGKMLTCDDKHCGLMSGIDGARGMVRADEGRVMVVLQDGSTLLVRRDSSPQKGPRLPRAIAALAYIPWQQGYPFPREVEWIRQSHAALPKGGDLERPRALASLDSGVSPADYSAPQRGFTTPLVFGTVTYRKARNGELRYYNTAMLLDSQGMVVDKYDKVYLLIFGEYLPLSNIFPFLKAWFPEAGDFTPGTEVKVFSTGKLRMGVMVCYEDIIADFTRRLSGKAPNVLVNITNDAWFGKTSEPFEHLHLATFRAIENRLFLVRATNTGVSAVVDPVGRIIEESDLDHPERFWHDVALLHTDTFYRKHGDLFAWIVVVVALALVLAALFHGKQAQ